MLAALTPDPVLIFQIVLAGFIILTLPRTVEGKDSLKANAKAKQQPFVLGDGNYYIEHAGMTIENELYQTLHFN